MSAEIWLGPPAIPFPSHFHPVIVKDIQNLTNWKNAFFDHPAPYLTDKGFPNPPCFPGDDVSRTGTHVRGARGVPGDGRPPMRNNHTTAGTYVIGEDNDCVQENNTDHFCNGPLKPNTVYVWVHDGHTQTQF